MLDILLSQNIFLLILSLFATGAFGALIFYKNDSVANLWSGFFATVGSVLGILFSLAILSGDTVLSLKVGTSFPALSLVFDIDYLSAFFIFIISLISLVCSIYSIGYIKHYYKKHNIGVLGFFYNIFIASMVLVVTASDIRFFLIVWEIMSLASFFLVVFERREESIKAGYLYFIMTHIGTAFIFLSFLLMYMVTGAFDFENIKNGLTGISPLLSNLIFMLALIGFGTKAGIIPFHIWLPVAHPSAPSHISALMSGVMIKTGIYMIARICLDIMPNTPAWWGMAILIAGAVSSVLGVLYALAEHDIKRLLAYHSIENIGIILLGLGSSLVFLSYGMNSLAVIGLVASLYHIINHAIFKALLFMGAGSIVSGTHTRNIEEYGGLIKTMPQTAFFFLVGSMAISALPPFNGFFSEWVTFQSLFQGVIIFDPIIKMVFVFSIGSLALTGGLAAACFVKAFGVTFLARPRSEEAKHSKESTLSVRFGMAILAALTLVFGIFSGFVSKILLKISSNLIDYGQSSAFFVNNNVVTIQDGFSSVSVFMIFIALVSVIIFVFIFTIILSGKRRTEIKRTWDCGADLEPRMEITATAFSRSIVVVFKNILRPIKQMEYEFSGSDLKYFPKSRNVILGFQDIYDLYFYGPIKDMVINFSHQVKKIQSGNINEYILYIFLMLIALLLFLAS